MTVRFRAFVAEPIPPYWKFRAFTFSVSICKSGTKMSRLPEGAVCRLHDSPALVSEMMEARDERRLLRFQNQMAAYQLLIIDELGSCRFPRSAQNCCSS
jgi:hypothetical protein